MNTNPTKNTDLQTYQIQATRSRMINWIAKRRWWVFILVAILIVSFVIFDSMHPQTRYIYIVEFVIFLVPLLIIGLLLDRLLHDIQIQTQTAKLLDYKHKLSLEFSGYHDWEMLVTQLARFPSTVTDVAQTCLFVCDTISRQFMPVADWTKPGETDPELQDVGVCEKYAGDKTAGELRFGPCETGSKADPDPTRGQTYCLPILYGENLLGILQFKLTPRYPLTAEQADIFRNVGDEIGIALNFGQDRKVFFEMRSSETALAERRSVSDYLHDHLGQNLGFLHFKLDQLLSEKDRPSLERVFHDLEHMRNAANDSYEILRGVLETIHPETTPLFTNLLLEHARKVCERSNINLNFLVKGKPIFLPVDLRQAIFYAFEESLNNAEKHARASKVNVLAEWGQDHITLTISDDGVGFNPKSVNTDQHFGLEILNERMARVNGQITLTTSNKSGTVVNILVPNSPDNAFRGNGQG